MTSDSTSDDALQHKWYVLNFFSRVSSKKEFSPEECVARFNQRENIDLKLFHPTFVAYREQNGKKKKVDVPLAFHYTFVKGSFLDIKKLCGEPNSFSFVLNKSTEERYATVDEATMEGFKKIALKYSNNLPFYSLEGLNLEDYDKVQVVEGDFPGLIGYYSPSGGSNSGRILLRITRNMGTVAYDIKAKYIRVLEFSKNFRRAYDLIDAFIPRLYEAMRKYSEGEPLDENELSNLHSFCRRMGVCRLDNPKIEAKLQAILVMANQILGNDADMEKARVRFEKKKKSVTSDATLAFISLLEYVRAQEPELLQLGKDYLEKIQSKSSRALDQLRKEYEYYMQRSCR